MANAYTSTYTTGYSDSLVRDVDSKIYNASPEETPFVSNIGSSSCEAREFEWLEDELDPVGENAKVEGFDPEVTEAVAPSLLKNYVQIFEKDVSITGTAKKVKMYGRKDDLARQRGLKLKSIKRDIDYALLNGVLNAGSKTTARMTRGALNWVDTTTSAYYSFSDKTAATNHITEDILIGVLQGIWDNGLEPNAIFAPMTQRIKISDFTQNGRVTINQNADTGKLSMYVDLIKTDLGLHKLYSERNIAETEVTVESANVYYQKILVCNKDVFEKRVLRPVEKTVLAKTGDNEKEMFVTELGLQCNTQKGVGSIVNLTKTAKP